MLILTGSPRASTPLLFAVRDRPLHDSFISPPATPFRHLSWGIPPSHSTPSCQPSLSPFGLANYTTPLAGELLYTATPSPACHSQSKTPTFAATSGKCDSDCFDCSDASSLPIQVTATPTLTTPLQLNLLFLCFRYLLVYSSNPFAAIPLSQVIILENGVQCRN